MNIHKQRRKISAFSHPRCLIAGHWKEAQPGMALRDWFAGQALAGLCAARGADENLDDGIKDSKIVFDAYVLADSMMGERELE